MRHDNRQPAGGQSRADLYQKVTGRVIAELEKDSVPWVRPRDQSKSGLAMPQNATIGRHCSEGYVRHADYIGNWLTILKNDSRAIVSAASHASKASEFLLAFTDQAQRAA